MNRFLQFAAIALIVVIAGCSVDAPVTSSDELAGGKDRGTVQGNCKTSTFRYSYTSEILPPENWDEWQGEYIHPYNGCMQEFVQVNIDVHVVETRCYNDDGTYSSQLRFNVKGDGVGLTSGKKYQLMERSLDIENPAGFFCPWERTIEARGKTVVQGPGNNSGYYFKLTMRMDENCNFTFDDESITFDCK